MLFASSAIIVSPLAVSSAVADDDSSKKKKSKKRKKQRAKKGAADKPEAEEVEESAPRGEPASHESFDKELVKPTQIDAILLLDASRSMTRTDPLRLRDQGAKLFVRFLSANDRVAVLQFDKEVKTVLDLQAVNPNDLSQIDSAIEAVPMDGGFTDLQLAVEAARRALSERGRTDAIKAIVVLSDGKMDPHPSRGTGEQLLEQLRKVDLPNLRERDVKLYSLSLSDEADRALLQEMADATGGLHWFAPDGKTVHIKFSELFLALKKPQVVPLEGSGFEIDHGVEEATFYIAHKDGIPDVTLIDPTGAEITSTSLTADLKWFKSELYDVITIRHPAPGKWGIRGIEDPEGFATLLTDLKLQVKWPEENHSLGDRVLLAARLTEKDEIFSPADAESILFFNYKLVAGQDRSVVAAGELNDRGEDGDAKAGDGIYSTSVKIDAEGENVLLVSVTSPTFTRQQSVPFTVRSNLVELVREQGDQFEGEGGGFRILLEPEARKLSKLDVKLIARRVEGGKNFAIPVKEDKGAKGSFIAPASIIPAGVYEVFARITWQEDGKEEAQQSKSLEFESTAPVEVEEIVLEEPEEDSHLLIYGVFLLLAAGWGGGIGYVALTRFRSDGKESVQVLPVYKIPEEIEAKLAALRARASKERREPTDEDLAMRDTLLSQYSGAPAAVADAEAEIPTDLAVSTESAEPASTEEDVAAAEPSAAEVSETDVADEAGETGEAPDSAPPEPEATEAGEQSAEEPAASESEDGPAEPEPRDS